MSYDLDFWKYKENVYLNNQMVYTQSSDGELVDGLEDLPIEEIREEIRLEFSDWDMEDQDSWKKLSGKGSFNLYTTSCFVRFDCYGMTGEDMNRIIDVMLKFSCPLYDPQAGRRFDGRE